MLAKMCRGKYFCKKKKLIITITVGKEFVLKEWSCFLVQFCDGVCIEEKMQKNIILHTSRSLVVINMEVSFFLGHMFRKTNKQLLN